MATLKHENSDKDDAEMAPHDTSLENPAMAVERHDGLLLDVLSYSNVSDVVRSKRVNKRWQCLCNKSIDNNFQPKKEFQAEEFELQKVAKKYCTYNKNDIDEIGRTYGFPINKWLVGKVEDFSHVFDGQKNFNEDINDWDMSNAERLVAMFRNARSFNKPLDTWDTSKVQTLSAMFCNAEAFNQPLASWKTSDVIAMHSVFLHASSFNQPLNSWDTSGVRTMCAMFEHATSFNQSMDSWDTSQVEDVTRMFANATSFNQSLAFWICNEELDEYAIYGVLHGATAFQQAYPGRWNPNAIDCLQPGGESYYFRRA